MYKYIKKDQLIVGKTYAFSRYITGLFKKDFELYKCKKCKETYNVLNLNDKDVKINRFTFLNIKREDEKDTDIFSKYDVFNVRCTICSEITTLSYYKNKEIAIRVEVVFV